MQKFAASQRALLNRRYVASGDAIATSSIALDGGLAVGAVSVASFLTQFASAAQGALAVAAQPALTYALFQDQQTAGTNGGDFNSGSMVTRVLNTTVVNTISGASLASNQIILPAGTYVVWARAPACKVDSHQAQLYSITASAIILTGSASRSAGAGTPSQTDSVVLGAFTLASAAAVELQHRCQSTGASTGLGVATNLAAAEVYSQVFLVKV